MKPQRFTLTIEVSVFDPQALWDDAARHALEDGIPEESVPSFIGTRDAPNIAACLVMVGDPGDPFMGTDILDSSAEPCE